MKKNGMYMSVLALFVGLATHAHAAGSLIFCSDASPAGFDIAQYSAVSDSDASAETVYNTLVAFKRGRWQEPYRCARAGRQNYMVTQRVDSAQK